MAAFAEGEFAPLTRIGDTVGAKWSDGVVTMPEGFRGAYQAFVQDGWGALSGPQEYGGQGLPFSLATKFRLDANGRPTIGNDGRCASIEHKLGIHASPTCVISYGDNDACLGELIGPENGGMRNVHDDEQCADQHRQSGPAGGRARLAAGARLCTRRSSWRGDGALCYRSRPDGDDPDKCIFDIWSLVRYAPGREPTLERKVYHDMDGNSAGAILDQDIPIWARSRRA